MHCALQLLEAELASREKHSQLQGERQGLLEREVNAKEDEFIILTEQLQAYLLLATCYLLPAACCLLLTTVTFINITGQLQACLLRVARFVLLAPCSLLLAPCSLLLVTCYLLLAT